MLGASTLALGASSSGPGLTYISNIVNNTCLLYSLPGLSGDIMVVYAYSSYGSLTTPTGWTAILNTVTGTPTNNYYHAIFYKIRGSTDTFPSIGTSFIINGAIWRPSRPVSQSNILVSSYNSLITDSAPANQTLTMAGVSGTYLGLAHYESLISTAITTRGSTVTATREINFYAANSGYLKTFENSFGATPFANSTISMADYGVNWLSTVVLKIT